MKNLIVLMAMVLSNSALATSWSPVLAVSDCKPYQKVLTNFGAMFSGSYTNFRFATKTCEFDLRAQKYVVRVSTTVVDLGFFEDNDNDEVTANLKARCEALREEALGEVVGRNETPCRNQR